MADSLANKGHSLPFFRHLFNDRHPAVARWLAYDRLRLSQPRLVLHSM
ncbi:hypothetical protein LINGRAHAP2_LOCUS13364 [Linum grandiflorum]